MNNGITRSLLLLVAMVLAGLLGISVARQIEDRPEIRKVDVGKSAVTFKALTDTNTVYWLEGSTNLVEWYKLSEEVPWTNSMMSITIEPVYVRVFKTGYARICAAWRIP